MAEVGVVGGYGSVGRAAAAYLAPWTSLRIGGRDGEKAAELAAELKCEHAQVDAGDEVSLARFCEGLRLVVSCAGPPREIGDRVVRAARHAHYVDASGDDRLFAQVTGHPGRAAILAAGMMPGLSGLLPRAFREAGRPLRLDAWVGGCGKLTHTAALDYLQALQDGFGRPLTALRQGQPVRLARSEQRLPFFPRVVTALPFLSSETERLASALEVADLTWHNVFDGVHLLSALSQGDAAALCRAATLDGFGRRPYQLMLFQLTHPHRTRTLVLRGASASQLTGAAVAVTVRSLLAGEVGPGVRFMAEALDPQLALQRLRQLPGIELQILDGPALLEEGVL